MDEKQKQTIEAAVEGMTGWDEIAVEARFGADIMQLQDKPTRMMRAVAFVQERHKGTPDKEAYDLVMGESMAALMDRFEEVETDLGEDETPSE